MSERDLLYKEAPNSEEVLGVISLMDVLKVTSEEGKPGDGQENKWKWHVCTKSRDYPLISSSAETRSEWVRKLKSKQAENFYLFFHNKPRKLIYF